MKNSKPLAVYIILFIPWLFSLAFKFNPALSYFIAWFGSFFIFYITLSGKLKSLPNDRKIAEQLMRPIFLVQLIFAGYMCCTSIFYFFDLLGYDNFKKGNNFFAVNDAKLMLTAQCQRYYCLAHASFALGILWFMEYPTKQKYQIENRSLANLLMIIALITLPISTVLLYLPGLTQFANQLTTLSFIAGTLALAFAIPLQKKENIIICLVLYCFNFYHALVSGYKEPIIISILVLGVFLYPNYKKSVTVIFLPLIIALFFLLPTYNNAFRQKSWTGELNEEDARRIAIDAVRSADSAEDDWAFFVYRLSEIDMFTIFISSTPAHVNYYGTKLLVQSAVAIVPRVFWPSKPITENMVMERVYEAGVIYRQSEVSAKPAFVVDAYLSGGPLGIFIYLFIYGAAAQLISMKAERLFGGYILGTALIFSGLFQIFWRGLSFEFVINSVFWSYITMLIIFNIFRSTRILTEISKN